VSSATITLCVASQRVFIVVSVYFVIHSVRKLVDIPSYRFHVIKFYDVLRVRDAIPKIVSPHFPPLSL
jgi:hypothetical protein